MVNGGVAGQFSPFLHWLSSVFSCGGVPKRYFILPFLSLTMISIQPSTFVVSISFGLDTWNLQ